MDTEWEDTGWEDSGGDFVLREIFCEEEVRGVRAGGRDNEASNEQSNFNHFPVR
jgi:hypothetical protein